MAYDHGDLPPLQRKERGSRRTTPSAKAQSYTKKVRVASKFGSVSQLPLRKKRRENKTNNSWRRYLVK